MKALVAGRNEGLSWALPEILSQAGFQVDVIASSAKMRYAPCVKAFEQTETILQALRKRAGYDWYVITDDATLLEIAHTDWPIEEKLKFLPVVQAENMRHLGSKIALSETFQREGIATPEFVVANDKYEAIIAAKRIGYPVFIKRDASSGGAGVFECFSLLDFRKIGSDVWQTRVLVQKKIEGEELDLSAIYLRKELVHFSYAYPLSTTSQFGPSFLRRYVPLSKVDEKVFEELRQIGSVLGIHGFANLACIQKAGNRFYFEADVRPNVWVSFSRFLGEDPSKRIRQWFEEHKSLSDPVTGKVEERVIPYFLRLKRSDLLRNRYSVWRYIPKGGYRWLFCCFCFSLIRRIFHRFFKQKA